MLVGAAVRLAHVMPADFPLNDGGLFYAMTEDLRREHFALPTYTSYNGAHLPFVYPPLALYFTGLLADATPWSLLDLFHGLPLLVSSLTIGAFFFLARSLVRGLFPTACATLAFALLPGSYVWLIMGGGVTRAVGLLLAILAVHQALNAYRRPRALPVCLGAVFLAGAILSHPEMGWFALYTIGLFFFAYGRNRANAVRTGIVIGGAGLLTLPWWAIVVQRHGLTPFASAGNAIWTLQSLGILATLRITGEGFFPVLGVLALAGLLWCLRARSYLLPLWLALIFVLTPRSMLTMASLPLGLLAGIGASRMLPWMLYGPREFAHTTSRSDLSEGMAWTAQSRRSYLLPGILGFILLYATVADTLSHQAHLGFLGEGEREAMGWIAQHTDPSSVFALVTGDFWPGDRSSEWFPALTQRTSATTVQGYEWAGPGVMSARAARSLALQSCAFRDAACLRRWEQETGVTVTHVYVPKRPPVDLVADVLFTDCCWSLRTSLSQDPAYTVVYDGPGATVYERSIPRAGWE